MKKGTILLLALVSFLLTSQFGFAQHNFEVGGYVGGQINGGVDFSTTLFKRLEVQNGVNYGVTAGPLLGEHYAVEFQWNHNSSGTLAQPRTGASSLKVFNLTNNQYMGNFLFHLTNREAKLRPYLLAGLGASALSTDRSGVSGSTRFTFAVGAGAKYNLGQHFGLRGQFRYVPTYLGSTSSGGYWCDPIWGGCWIVGSDHYLNQFDVTGGVTFRF